MSLVTGGEKIGGDVAFSRDVGDDLDFFGHFRKLGEELSFGVALENLGRKAVSAAMSGSETVCVGFVEKYLGLEHVGSAACDFFIVTKGDVEEHLDGGTALHVREQFKGESGCDLLNNRLTKDDFFEELSLYPGSTRGAREGVVDEKLEGFLAMLVLQILDLCNHFREQGTIINGLGIQSLSFSLFDLVEVFRIQIHKAPQ